FALSGVAAALAGVLYLAKVGSAQPDVGGELPLTAVAAIVVGGTSITGGSGAIYRTLVGVFFLGLIGNGFNLLGWNPLYEQIIEGTIILAAVAVDVHARRT
ncbi:MAG TPA: ABC transporter permease, partial [Solirubrobacterales bacterium]